MRGFRQRLTYANVMSTLALVIALGTGSAYAANTVFSEDIVNGEVKGVDIGTNAVTSGKVAKDALTGADIKNQSGVDSCIESKRLGQLCYRVENLHRPFSQALAHCANLGLRLPTYGEAMQLVKNRDVPNIDQTEDFWTDEFFQAGAAWAVTDGEATVASSTDPGVTAETVCVTTPTN